MAPRTDDGDDLGHRAVMSNLRDLQARLRGDPASLVLPRDGRRGDDGVSVQTGDVSVTAPAGSDPAGDPVRRIEALRRKLELLELEIDAYEQAGDEPAATGDRPAQADVVGLQHAVDERLADG